MLSSNYQSFSDKFPSKYLTTFCLREAESLNRNENGIETQQIARLRPLISAFGRSKQIRERTKALRKWINIVLCIYLFQLE